MARNALQCFAFLLPLFSIHESPLKKMVRVLKGSSSFVPSSVLSIIGGSLMIIGGLLPLGMLGMSGHFGMMSEMDTGEMMGEVME